MILKTDKLKITLGELQEILENIPRTLTANDTVDVHVEAILERVTKKHMINEAFEESEKHRA